MELADTGGAPASPALSTPVLLSGQVTEGRKGLKEPRREFVKTYMLPGCRARAGKLSDCRSSLGGEAAGSCLRVSTRSRIRCQEKGGGE